MKTELTKWRIESETMCAAIVDGEGRIGYFDSGDAAYDEENAARAVACVNACAGLATDQLEKLALIQSDEGVAGLGCMAVALKVTRDHLDEVSGALQAIMDDSMSDVRKSLYAGAKDALDKLAKMPK